jgi:FAD:protein FMN transferase
VIIFGQKEMKNSLRNILSLPVILILLSSCRSGTGLFHNHAGFTQGTTFSIVYEEKLFTGVEKINNAIDRKLIEIDNSLSLYNKASGLSRINRNEISEADEMFTEVFKISERVSELTDGLFDITVGPLVKAWGFGPDAMRNFDPSRVDSLLVFVGFGKVRLVDGLIEKDDSRIYIDVNAVAQGYSVDVICRLLDDFGIMNYLVEIGGEVRARGMKTDRFWRVGVDMPEESNTRPGEKMAAVIELNNEALATSGNYRKFYLGDDGVKYTHTINPVTGVPARNLLLSATIVAPDAATADAFATACMVAGPEGAKGLIEKYNFLEGYLIYSGERGQYVTWSSDGLKERLREE